MPLHKFEQSIRDADPMAIREARIAFISDGISLYHDELQWRRSLSPHRFLWYLFPLAWPILWYRSRLSKMALSAISRAIADCRARWAEDLQDSELDFDQIIDPLESQHHG
ncbi:hypothetical protein [Symmachiella macrocystis]|nr:hypothetical protein [Symmachiella macrocystis]